MAHDNNAGFPIPFRNAPFNTHHIVDAEDFKTTNLTSFVRHNSHAIERAVYYANRERRANQSVTCKLDAPYRLWLTEKESRRKDYIKFKFEKRGINRPSSHLVTKKEIQDLHKHREIDDYHLSRQVEICENTIHPEHHLLALFPHTEQYHNPTAAAIIEHSLHPSSSSPTTIKSGNSSPSKLHLPMNVSPSPQKPRGKQPKWSPSKAAIAAVANASQNSGSSSASKLPSVKSPGKKEIVDGKKSLW